MGSREVSGVPLKYAEDLSHHAWEDRAAALQLTTWVG